MIRFVSQRSERSKPAVITPHSSHAVARVALIRHPHDADPPYLEGLNEEQRLANALVQHRAAEATLRQALAAKALADTAADNAATARADAEAEAHAAQEVISARPPPPAPVRPAHPQAEA